MTAATRLGAAYRKLASLIGVRSVRADDERRAPHRSDASGFAKRVTAIEAEALALEESL